MNNTLIEKCVQKAKKLDLANDGHKVKVFMDYVIEPVFNAIEEIKGRELSYRWLSYSELQANIGANAVLELIKRGVIDENDCFFVVENDYFTYHDHLDGYSLKQALISMIDDIETSYHYKHNDYILKGFNDDYKSDLEYFLGY